MQSQKFTSGLHFAWIMSEQAFSDSAKQGVIVAMTFSFIILLAITRNIVVSVLSIISVGVVILSVLCIMVLKGYELGVSESICVVISIGLSVDYVVHLAQDYMHSSHKNRSSKMK